MRPAFEPGGARLAATLEGARGNNFLIAWRAADGKELFRQALAGSHTRVTYNPDGRVLVDAGPVNGVASVEKFDAQTGRPQGSWPIGAPWVTGAACGPGGVVAVATWGERPAIKLFRLADGREWGTLEGHVGAVTALAFSPDGRRLVAAGSDLTVRLWDTASGRELLTFREHYDIPGAVAWSPDGRRIASAGRGDKMVKVWEARAADPPPRTDDWPVLFHDSFPADGAATGWNPLDGSWEVRDGTLRGRLARKTYAGVTFPVAQASCQGVKLPRTVEVRFAYRAGKPRVIGVFLVAPNGQQVYGPLLCGGALPFGQPCAKLQQVSQGVKVSHVGMARPFAMHCGRWQQVRVLREPERIRVYVDGVEVLSEPIPDVELSSLMLQDSWGPVGDEVEFKDVEIRVPAGRK